MDKDTSRQWQRTMAFMSIYLAMRTLCREFHSISRYERFDYFRLATGNVSSILLFDKFYFQFKVDEDTLAPVYFGNTLKPKHAKEAPTVSFDSTIKLLSTGEVNIYPKDSNRSFSTKS